MNMQDTIDLVVESPLWRQSGLDLAALGGAARAACARHNSDLAGEAEISLIWCDDASIAARNQTWRGKTAPTNVLSFPVAAGPLRAHHLGDILLSYETIAREAQADGKSLSAHILHLLVHGMLHLVGYDHIEAEEAERMEQLERDILYIMGIPDPYAGDMSLVMRARNPDTPS